MSTLTYHTPQGGHPAQGELMTGRAVFTETYAVIPASVMRDIVTSRLPHWQATRAWILARPMSGFAETFSQYLMEVAPNGGSTATDADPNAQSALLIMQGQVEITLSGNTHNLGPGGFAYIPPSTQWTLHNRSTQPTRFHWIRKHFQPVESLAGPDPIVAGDADITPTPMPGTDGRWATTHFIDPEDLRYDLNVNIVTLQPGSTIPFEETHVMEHGIYILQGKGVYRLNRDWVEVEAGDFIWLRAFCPQACYAGGPEPFRYLLYKDVNRHARLSLS